MARNSSGTHSLPSGPVVPGTTISTTWANSTLGDVSAELTDSLSRSGKGGALAPIRGVDGSVAAPAYAFTAETGTGWYKAAAGDLRLAIAGVDILSFRNNVLMFLVAGNPIIQATGANSALSIVGNRTATDTGTDVAISTVTPRTAGSILRLQNGGDKTLFDYQGLISLASQAAAIQPASIWTAITPDTNITADNGAAYWKDPTGVVRFKGRLTNNTGGPTTNVVSTSPLPAGFRPAFARSFACSNSSTGFLPLVVGVAGTLIVNAAFANGVSINLDGVSFLAEA